MALLTVVDLMALLDLPGVGPGRVKKILCRAVSASLELHGDEPSIDRISEDILTAEQLSGFSESRAHAHKQLEQLRKQEVYAVGITDKNYPRNLLQRLGSDAPLVLLCRGNMSLFERVSVGFCGSRAASEKGLATASDSASVLARRQVNVVSGFAAGVDMKAHQAALSVGGTTTIVLAEGLLRFRIKKEIQSAWDEGRTLVVSEFGAKQPWSVGHAMQRNKTICALSNALILVEARSEGGSIAAGRECLKMGLPLFAAVYEGEPDSSRGNQEVLRLGAKPLMKSRSTNLPNLKAVIDTLPSLSVDAPQEDTRSIAVSEFCA